MKTVKVLGAGCPKCERLFEAVEAAAHKNNISIRLEKITDINEIIKHGVMMTPALVVDGDVKTTGKIPREEEIVRYLQ